MWNWFIWKSRFGLGKLAKNLQLGGIVNSKNANFRTEVTTGLSHSCYRTCYVWTWSIRNATYAVTAH